MLQEYIIGDAGYPLLPWLIVPYARGVDKWKDDFNYMLSSTRMCVERSFGRLKGTWRILSRVLWKPRIKRLGPMIVACCVLHNLIIDRNDGLSVLYGSTIHLTRLAMLEFSGRTAKYTEGGYKQGRH